MIDLSFIRRLIGRTGLDYQTLSTKIGASVKSIYKWWNGTSMPSCHHLIAMLALVEEREGGLSIKGI